MSEAGENTPDSSERLALERLGRTNAPRSYRDARLGEAFVTVIQVGRRRWSLSTMAPTNDPDAPTGTTTPRHRIVIGGKWKATRAARRELREFVNSHLRELGIVGERYALLSDGRKIKMRQQP